MFGIAYSLRSLCVRLLLALPLCAGTIVAANVLPADAQAQLSLGERYALGEGVPVDPVRAVQWFRLSAEQGNAEAQFKLAWMLEKGMGTLKSEGEALFWYQRAAAQGHSIAANNLGGMYEDGRGTQADPREAFRWYYEAAERGLGHGHYNLALAYRDGLGVPQDLELARKHFQVARRQGVAEAAAKLADVERRLAHTASGPIEPCGDTPQRYLSYMFGELLYSLDAGCMRTMTGREQTFTAGMSQYFVNRCGHPADARKRSRLLGFLTSSGLVATGGRQYSNPNVMAAVGDQLDNATLFTMGTEAAAEIGCNEISERLAANIVAYLDQTASGRPGEPSYVDGCVAHYAGRYGRAQCECLANIGRGVFPDIHSQRFTPASIKSILGGNPLLGFQIMLQCGVVEY